MDGVRKRDGDERAERRRRYRLRAVFDSAFMMLESFFDPAAGWGGRPLQHLVFRIVRENFPELTSEEVHSMIGALQRAYMDRTAATRDHSAHVENNSEVLTSLF